MQTKSLRAILHAHLFMGVHITSPPIQKWELLHHHFEMIGVIYRTLRWMECKIYIHSFWGVLYIHKPHPSHGETSPSIMSK